MKLFPSLVRTIFTRGGEMGMLKTKLFSLALAASVGLTVATPAVAANVQAQVRKEMRDELRDKAGSRPGLLRSFLQTRAAIGSGKLTAKTDTTLTVEKDGKSYTVNIDSKTQLRRRFWGKATLAEMSVGDTLNIIGLWADDVKTTINARLVRDISVQKRFGVFLGEVKSLLGNGWVMSTVGTKRPDQTVTVSATTKFVNRKEETIAQADVAVGHRVRVKGLWDTALNTVTDVTHVKDFSLPLRATPTVTATVTPTP